MTLKIYVFEAAVSLILTWPASVPASAQSAEPVAVSGDRAALGKLAFEWPVACLHAWDLIGISR